MKTLSLVVLTSLLVSAPAAVQAKEVAHSTEGSSASRILKGEINRLGGAKQESKKLSTTSDTSDIAAARKDQYYAQDLFQSMALY
jgi:hypothetical protein